MINEYKDRIKAEAEELVLEHFPRKVLCLDELLKSEKFNRKNLTELYSEVNIPISDNLNQHFITDSEISGDGVKVLAFPNGTIFCNKHIVELVDIVKPLYQQLVDDANKLKNWIQVLIPRIEDGNNFGVSIQESVLSSVCNVEHHATGCFEQISQYFMNRGKVVSKVAKFPHVDDFRRTIQEMDEKEYVYLRLYLTELVDYYTILHDKITKNLEKIKKPRTENSQTFIN